MALLRKRKELPDAAAAADAAAAGTAAAGTAAGGTAAAPPGGATPPGGAAPPRPATGPASSRELPELEAEDTMAPLAAAEVHAPPASNLSSNRLPSPEPHPERKVPSRPAGPRPQTFADTPRPTPNAQHPTLNTQHPTFNTQWSGACPWREARAASRRGGATAAPRRARTRCGEPRA